MNQQTGNTTESAPDSSLTTHAWEAIENPNVRNLPNYLKQFIVDQNYDAYTPVDHAVWRYVLRQNHDFLREYAHLIYFEGLEKTGLEIEHIPSINEMNLILGKIGWAAVCVNGFIPPAAFMGFQARRVLVIAADMRQIHHIEYTPSPDIIHEAAGHAPVIADTEYAEYLRLFGEIGEKAMSSRKDFELYEAIRKLSILKETPGAAKSDIDQAHADVLHKQDNLGKPSEIALLSRLHWWTVEFGLIGDLTHHKIYGAGLLSSIGESFRCMTPAVTKLPYDINAADYAFDITTEQPHLFVTPDFTHLIDVLERYADTMAFRVGGIDGINKAIESESTATCQYRSGLQVSGTFSEVLTDSEGNPAYIRTSGPTALAFDNVQIDGHGKDYHSEGFGSPIGYPTNADKPLESFSDSDLESHGLISGRSATLGFSSGVVVSGRLDRILRRNDRILLMTFSNCTVTHGDRVLFTPDWGAYDMAVGACIDSVFSGAADKDAYEQPSMVSRTRTIKVKYSDSTRRLHDLYQKIRNFREGRLTEDPLSEVWKELREGHDDDWLLAVEILELLTKSGDHPELREEIKSYLKSKAELQPGLAKLITDGLRLASK